MNNRYSLGLLVRRLGFEPVISEFVKKYSGLCICFIIVLAATKLSEYFFVPSILLAMVLGLSLRQLSEHENFLPGFNFCAGILLKFAIVLMGFRLAFAQILSFGIDPAKLLLLVPATVIFSVVLAKVFKLGNANGLVTGCAVAICGVAAATAIAAVLPRRDERDLHLLCTVLGVTAVSTVAMLLYPAIAVYLQLPDESIGLFLGASIHDVAHVVGAGYLVSEQAGDAAVYMKMLRVALLIPAIIVACMLTRMRVSDSTLSGVKQGFPVFLVFFVLAVILVNTLTIPNIIQDAARQLSIFCLQLAIVALAIKVKLEAIWTVAKNIVILLIANSLFIALGAFLLVRV